jgi:hypothetical protein
VIYGEEALTQQFGRIPDDRELARHPGVPEDDVRLAYLRAQFTEPA